MKANLSAKPVYCLALILFLFGCGIEEYPYIYPVPPNSVSEPVSNYSITVRIPNNNYRNSFFTHYEFFYKIYLSDIVEYSPMRSNFSSINQTLYSDFVRIEPYEDGTTLSTSILSDFTRWGFFSIDELRDPEEDESTSISKVLDESTFNQSMEIFFSQIPGELPALRLGEKSYNLLRSDRVIKNVSFPNNDETKIYFVNDFLNTNRTSINEYNIDVVDKANRNSGEVHSYACIYIVACGLNFQTFTPIYSTPKFLHVMRLPDPRF